MFQLPHIVYFDGYSVLECRKEVKIVIRVLKLKFYFDFAIYIQNSWAAIRGCLNLISKSLSVVTIAPKASIDSLNPIDILQYYQYMRNAHWFNIRYPVNFFDRFWHSNRQRNELDNTVLTLQSAYRRIRYQAYSMKI